MPWTIEYTETALTQLRKLDKRTARRIVASSMNAEHLLTHFDRITDAPDAIPRLRRFILNLAVRGKLVKQDPEDEPASELLKRIAAEKRRMVEAGEIKKARPRLPISDETPFNLPDGWAWSTVGEICSKTGSGSTPRGGKNTYREEGIVFLRSQNVYDDGLRLYDVAYIDAATHTKMSGTVVRPGDLLLNITGGSMGRCCRVPDDFDEANVSQHVAIIRIAVHGLQDFVHRLILSPYFQSFIFGEQTGAGRGGLPKNKMDLIPLAIPPLAEQHRIVAKVDELMALCDRLETARKEREATRDRLAAASLARLNAPDPDLAIFQNHAAFALDNLTSLTTRPDQIKALRQTILNLAVRGKLVKQKSSEGGVDDLLEKFSIQQKRLIGEKKIKHSVATCNLEIQENLASIPNSWRWAPLGKLVSFGPQNGISPKATNSTDTPRAITLTATTSGTFNSSHFKHVEADVPADSEYWLRDGDLLFQRGNTREYVGIAAYFFGASGTLLYPDLIMKVRLLDGLYLPYIHLALVAPGARTYFSTHATGAQETMPKINQQTLLNAPVPLPPLAEQHRIVAKVDKLMAVCDRLEAGLAAGDETRGRLIHALLREALEHTSSTKGFGH